jgi:hypothetical protein
MKKNTTQFVAIVIVVLNALINHSCEENNPTPAPNYAYFVSKELKYKISPTDAKNKLLTFSTLYPETSVFGPLAKNEVEVQKYVYKTYLKDNIIEASGLVCLPKTNGSYPVICFQNGTNTLHSEAPSVNPKSDLFMIIESVASMGFIVVIPDYIGFGESSQLFHPYLHAESTVQSIVDLLRAVKEYGSENSNLVKPTNELYIMGYSQGGWATMQLQKTIESKIFTDYNLKASSCGAGPYSISFINEWITSQTIYPMPYFLTYLLNSFTALGLVENQMSDFVKAPYSAKISGLYDGKHSGSEINAQLTSTMSNLITDEYRTEYGTNSKFTQIRTAFNTNSITAWPIVTPTHLYHGANDVYIPVSMSQKMFNDFKVAGVTDKMELIIIPGFDHPTGVIPFGLASVLWFLELKN